MRYMCYYFFTKKVFFMNQNMKQINKVKATSALPIHSHDIIF